MQAVTRLRREAQSINNYMERDYYSGVAEHKPFITKINAHQRVQWCKKKKALVYGDMVRWVILHRNSYCMCGVHRENGTGLNAWPPQWRDPVALLCCRGAFCFISNKSLAVTRYQPSWTPTHRRVRQLWRDDDAVLAARGSPTPHCDSLRWCFL